MVLYNIVLAKQVRKKDLPAIPRKDRAKIIDAIDAIAVIICHKNYPSSI